MIEYSAGLTTDELWIRIDGNTFGIHRADAVSLHNRLTLYMNGAIDAFSFYNCYGILEGVNGHIRITLAFSAPPQLTARAIQLGSGAGERNGNIITIETASVHRYLGLYARFSGKEAIHVWNDARGLNVYTGNILFMVPSEYRLTEQLADLYAGRIDSVTFGDTKLAENNGEWTLNIEDNTYMLLPGTVRRLICAICLREIPQEDIGKVLAELRSL